MWDDRRRPTVSDKNLLRATFLLFCSRLVIAFLIELTPQEALLLEYAMHPALSYFDHPPIVAWVIRAGQFLLANPSWELGSADFS